MKEDWPQNLWTENWKMQGSRLVGEKVSIRVLRLNSDCSPEAGGSQHGQSQVTEGTSGGDEATKWVLEAVLEIIGLHT